VLLGTVLYICITIAPLLFHVTTKSEDAQTAFRLRVVATALKLYQEDYEALPPMENEVAFTSAVSDYLIDRKYAEPGTDFYLFRPLPSGNRLVLASPVKRKQGIFLHDKTPQAEKVWALRQQKDTFIIEATRL
jgi:hypothetical protein